MMFDIAVKLEPFLAWIRQACCWCDSRGGTGCAAEAGTPSAAACWTFAFGVWMIVLGLTFLLVPTLMGGSTSLMARLAKACGFPEVAGVWSRLFGLALAAFGLFYFVAAAFEVRAFFWLSIFGRIGVFMTCAVLAWKHARNADTNGAQPPNQLLLFATPDLLFANITAWILLPHALDRIAFVGGVALLVGALGFLTFPGWIMQLVGISARPDTWNIVLGALLGFFGIYDIAIAVAGLIPLLLPAVLANILLLFALLLGLLFEPQATRSTWQIRVAVGALLLLTTGSFVESIHDDQQPAAAERQPESSSLGSAP
jgi:hypothetical protein